MWSQKDSLKFVYRLHSTMCVVFCSEYRGGNWMLAAALLSVFEKFRPVILTANLCVCTRMYISYLKYLPNTSGQEIIIFLMCKTIKGSLLFWITIKYFFSYQWEKLLLMGQKFVYSVMYFRVYRTGNKARFPFPGGTEAGFRVDFYLLPLLDMERIEKELSKLPYKPA